MKRLTRRTNTPKRLLFCGKALLLGLLAAPLTVQAQTVTLFGSLANFDVLNNTGGDAHGFQIELDGLTTAQVPYYFTSSRYGGPQIVPFAGGVIVQYSSPWDPQAQQFTITTTTPISFAPTPGHSCVLALVVGCDHYGVVTSATPTNVVYRWLIADPANPGALIPFGGAPVSIPQPIVTVQPPAQVGGQPNVDFQIQLPPPLPPRVPPPAPQYGDAQWVKVYKTELQQEVNIDQLINDDPAVVPQNAGQLETEWKLLQFNPHSANSGVLHSQGGLGGGSRAVVRHYEHYQYTGQYDPITHQAICGGDGTCTTPQPGELGDFIGDQNAAANVGVPSITVTKTGNGNVNGGKINCGGACTTTVALNTVVTLTENPASNAAFTGWGGACQGTASSCTLTVNDSLNVTANFTTIFTLSIGRGGSGTVTGTPGGVNSTQINCGSACSAKFMQGTTVTLTATPPAGHTFVNWTGACSGTAPTCNVTINQDTQAQANFK